jgi:hypothetical protein
MVSSGCKQGRHHGEDQGFRIDEANAQQSLVDLLDAVSLLGADAGNVGDDIGHAFDRDHDLVERFTETIEQLDTALDRLPNW